MKEDTLINISNEIMDAYRGKEPDKILDILKKYNTNINKLIDELNNNYNLVLKSGYLNVFYCLAIYFNDNDSILERIVISFLNNSNTSSLDTIIFAGMVPNLDISFLTNIFLEKFNPNKHLITKYINMLKNSSINSINEKSYKYIIDYLVLNNMLSAILELEETLPDTLRDYVTNSVISSSKPSFIAEYAVESAYANLDKCVLGITENSLTKSLIEDLDLYDTDILGLVKFIVKEDLVVKYKYDQEKTQKIYFLCEELLDRFNTLSHKENNDHLRRILIS